jgi:hypothetical protein
MNTPLKKNKATSNLLKIEKLIYNEPKEMVQNILENYLVYFEKKRLLNFKYPK